MRHRRPASCANTNAGPRAVFAHNVILDEQVIARIRGSAKCLAYSDAVVSSAAALPVFRDITQQGCLCSCLL